MDIPLDEVIYVEAIATASTGAAADADSTPTFAVYEEATDTDIGVGGNMTKRTSLTGNYRASFTASAANGFEIGKWYSVIGSATIGTIATKGVLKTFRIVAAEAIAGYPKNDVHSLGGDAQSLTDLKDFADAGYDPSTNKVQGVLLVDTTTTLTNLPAITSNWITAAGLAADALNEIVDQVWDEILSGHAGVGSTGAALSAAGGSGDPWATAVPGAYGAGTAGHTLGTYIDAAITSRMASYTQPTGFLAATFPGTVASPTNITAASGITISGTTQTLDALQTAQNAAHGAGSWATATGFSTHSAADVWAVGSRTLTAFGFTVTTDDAASIATILSQVGSLYDATIITTFTVGATTSTTAFDTDLTAVDNYYRDQQAVFLTGNLRGSVPIQVYLNANGVIQTGEAMVAAPDPGSTGVLISRHMHTVQAIQSGLATQAELVDTHLDVNANGIAIAALNDISPAQVNAEVLDVLNVDTFAELSAPPAATSSLRAKLTWLFMWARNKSTETATQRKLYADDTTTVVSTEAVSDDATTFTKGEAV